MLYPASLKLRNKSCSYFITRMHSSRMRTVRSSGRISGGGVPGPGGYLVPGGCTWSWEGGVPGPRRGCTWSWGVYLVPGGCTWSWGVYLVPAGGRVPGPGGHLARGVYLVRHSPPPAHRRLAKRTPSPLWTDRHL